MTLASLQTGTTSARFTRSKAVTKAINDDGNRDLQM
jgi:hypothetical protein